MVELKDEQLAKNAKRKEVNFQEVDKLDDISKDSSDEASDMSINWIDDKVADTAPVVKLATSATAHPTIADAIRAMKLDASRKAKIVDLTTVNQPTAAKPTF